MICPIEYPLPSDAAGLTFLVVDDSTIMRRVVCNHLKALGITTFLQAAEAETAWTLLQSSPVDCILCDWNMPGMKGIELLSRVREAPALRHIPFLIVSAEAQPDYILEAISRGVTNYLTKPFTGPALHRKVAAALQVRRKAQAGANYP
ncbi:response regulator [Megalodesulfovibrio gigas]|uniref:Putative response regulator receiver protein (CheY) n=1 Tax=Megalodesulfovibrio gigas (strain ATCC 19364 / DSM 1382 / NCIMB 9332 / VKM B-1759) TaxID=1121448 RepID=T2G9V3_MEGG1|nr:response regulator [Megalodesulfovibrio gigas]AGW13375.1 putative response regulator receiver protein (CheY) [Megalodesulfovibrio gigas DSM 1382 = ATCC 19364]